MICQWDASRTERDFRPNPFLEFYIIVTKEFGQSQFFVKDPLREEAPKHDYEYASGDRIAEQDLSTNSPIEESGVRRMSRVLIDAACY